MVWLSMIEVPISFSEGSHLCASYFKWQMLHTPTLIQRVVHQPFSKHSLSIPGFYSAYSFHHKDGGLAVVNERLLTRQGGAKRVSRDVDPQVRIQKMQDTRRQ